MEVGVSRYPSLWPDSSLWSNELYLQKQVSMVEKRTSFKSEFSVVSKKVFPRSP